VHLVIVPWARPNSGFTLLFEGFAMALAMHMPIAVAAGFLKITDKRLWRVVFHYVGAAVARMDLSAVKRVCIDETAAKRGQDYITLVVDIDGRRVVFVADGRSADTVRQFADHLEDRDGDASRIKQACIDMSPAFISGVTENLTEAEITYDRFHVMKLIGDAVNDVRRAEVKARPELRGTRYVWIKNEPNLTAKQSAVLDTLSSTNLKTARAWRMRLAFQDIYAQPTRGWGELFFDKWIGWARRSRLEPMKAVARTMQKHREGILAWFESRISNGLIEGINSVVQAAKTKAHGYRNSETLKAVTYLVAGKLDLRLPT
jgi:transposase